ncbi:hypothetical protein ACVIJ6_006417 [Bradyrhizobium sp. USDA 4369]
MGTIVVSLRDIVAAFAGSLVLLAAIRLWGIACEPKPR